ncbi:hypothetical protein ACT3SZ_10245 [Corynebacterium sp. AOP40-9SA-29]|uniref:hypothetical protein n=1 Tax=Corynebacterium sp. AOP40-9SA-29 TaxID=3457677 RepID=UPI004033554D
MPLPHRDFSKNAEIFERTAHMRKDIPTDAVENIVREGRDHGADADRGKPT